MKLKPSVFDTEGSVLGREGGCLSSRRWHMGFQTTLGTVFGGMGSERLGQPLSSDSRY